MALIELKGVSRSFEHGSSETVWALRNVDLRVNRGDFLAILGPSGGGKSTLLAIIGALDHPTSGEYLLDGRSLSRTEDRDIAALRAHYFGFIFQDFHLLERRAAIDSVELGLLYQGVGRLKRRELAELAATQVGISDRLSERASLLSGGQRQRVAIARAIASHAPIILADEPTGNLDSVNGAKIIAELMRLHEAGSTVIVVTHSPDVAAAASRRVVITDGVLSEEGVTEDEAATDRPIVASELVRRPTLKPRDVLRDAIASVWSRGGQSVALCLAVAVAVAMSIITVGISQSAQSQVSAAFDAHLNREVSVSWLLGNDGPETAPETTAALDAVKAIAGVDYAAAITDFGQVSIASGAEHRVVEVHSGLGDVERATRATIDWLGGAAGQGVLASDEALIGRALATQLEMGPLQGRPQILIGDRAYWVRGIIDESNRLPLLAGEVVLAPDGVSSLLAAKQTRLLVLTAAGAAGSVGELAPIALDPYQPDLYAVSVPVDPAGLRGEVQAGVETALVAFTVLATLVALLTLTNAMSMAVISRRGEFGLRKALGASSPAVAALVSTESALLGVVGGVVGLITGIIAILVFTITQRWVPVFDVRLAPLALVLGIVIGVLGSVLGAVRAARTQPAIALRQ